MQKQAIKNLHVPLPDPLYKRLRKHSIRSHRPATAIAREAIDRWLDDQEKVLIDEAIGEYVRQMAGTSDDLDEDLEAASIESLLRMDE